MISIFIVMLSVPEYFSQAGSLQSNELTKLLLESGVIYEQGKRSADTKRFLMLLSKAAFLPKKDFETELSHYVNLLSNDQKLARSDFDFFKVYVLLRLRFDVLTQPADRCYFVPTDGSTLTDSWPWKKGRKCLILTDIRGGLNLVMGRPETYYPMEDYERLAKKYPVRKLADELKIEKPKL